MATRLLRSKAQKRLSTFFKSMRMQRKKLGSCGTELCDTSAIGQYKQPEIALVGEGAGADVGVQPDFSQVKKDDVEEIVKAFPRLKFKEAFVKTCTDVVRKHPRGASNSFMRDIRERYVTEFHPQSNFCDRIEQAPFAE